MFTEYVEILARHTKLVFQEMTGGEVLNYKVKLNNDKFVPAPFMHVITYEHIDKPVSGEFVIGFSDSVTNLAVASAMAEKMGLSKLTEMDDIGTDLINEFLNTIVGRTISEWDRNGMPVRFSPPKFQTASSKTLESNKKNTVYDIMLSLTFSHVNLCVTFSEENPPVAERKRLLVAEDSSVIRNIIAKTLEKNGFEVEQAENGQRAVELFETFLPELVIMDLVMPEMGGLEAIEAISQNNPNTKFIVLTSSSRRDEVITAKQLGVQSYLIKPFQPEKLMAAVNKALNL